MNSRLVSVTIFALAVTVGCRDKPAAQSAQSDPITPVQSADELSYVAEQSGCSASDQKLISTYSSAAVEALVAGNLERSIALSQQLDQKLSPGCLKELARSEPVRSNCSVDEKKIALTHYEGVIEATLRSNIARVFALLDDLEQSLSQKCWIAVNYPQDAEVQQACSSSELTLIASAAGPARQALKRAMMTGDVSDTFQLLQQLSARLSGDCQTALAQAQAKAQQKQQYPGGSPRPQMPDAIQDHGNGTYVMPGVGACTNNGCMAF